MRMGRSVEELAVEINRQNQAKRDYLAHSSQISALMASLPKGDPDAPEAIIHAPRLVVADVGELPITEHCHGQLAERLGIPTKYYNRMMSAAPRLWTDSLNTWLRELDENRMVRTLDGGARAFLSDRYRRLDNYDVAQVALPILLDAGTLTLASCEVTERRLYLKALFKDKHADVKVGDTVQAGVMITNSEVGDGTLSVTPFINRLVCSNGAVVNDAKWSRTHIGARLIAGDDVRLADDTIRAKDQATLLELRDQIHAAKGEVFERTVAKMRAATTGEQIKAPVPAVKELGRVVGLTEQEQTGVLEFLIRGGDYTRWGAMNAITEVSKGARTYDRATELEATGFRVIELPTSDWHRVAVAA